MKRFALVLAALTTGLVVSPLLTARFASAGGGGAAATAPADVPSVKVGVIDLERTLYETPAGKRASEAFEKTRTLEQAEIDKEQTDLQQAAADLDKQASILKPDVLKSKRDELERKYVDLQQKVAKSERELAGARANLIQDLLKQAGPIIDDLAKKNSVGMIVDQSAVLWADKKIDLTDELDARMK